MIQVYTYELVMWAIASLWFPEKWTMTWREAEGHSSRCVFQVRTISAISIPHKSTDEKKITNRKSKYQNFSQFQSETIFKLWKVITHLVTVPNRYKMLFFLTYSFHVMVLRANSDVVRKSCDKSVLPRCFTNKNT